MRTGLSWLLMALLATSAARAQSPVQPLVIAAEDGAGPWGHADGKGCGDDLVLAAYAAVNVPVKLEVMPNARAQHGVETGASSGRMLKPGTKTGMVLAF